MARVAFLSLTAFTTLALVGACNAILENKDLTADLDAGPHLGSEAADASFCTSLQARFPSDSSTPVAFCAEFDMPGTTSNYGGQPSALSRGAALTFTDATFVSPSYSLVASTAPGKGTVEAVDTWAINVGEGGTALPSTLSFDVMVEPECGQGSGTSLLGILLSDDISGIFLSIDPRGFALAWASFGDDGAAPASFGVTLYDAGALLPTSKWVTVTMQIESDASVPVITLSTRPPGSTSSSTLFRGPLTTSAGFITKASQVEYVLGINQSGDATPACTAYFDNFYVQSAAR
jgi:hypothetical protein